MVESMNKIIPLKDKMGFKLKELGSGLKTNIKQGIHKYNEYNKPENRISRLKSQITEKRLQNKLQTLKTQHSQGRQPLVGYADDNSFFIKPKKKTMKKKKKKHREYEEEDDRPRPVQRPPMYQGSTPLEEQFYRGR